MNESGIILNIKDLHVWYKTYDGYSKVLDGINMHVNKGEKVGLVGEAGCGKTTTMKAVLRILPEDQSSVPEGQIMFSGKDILKMKYNDLQNVRRKGISMIFQEPAAALNPVFTVGEQMADIIKYSNDAGEKQSKESIMKIAENAIKEVYIPDPERILNNYPHQLSGGMKQRICIAMSLMMHRDLIIADEPGTSLDVTIQDQVHRLLRGLVEKKEISLIMITHSLGVARELADRIYVMYAGNIVEVAKTKDLFSNPLHPYTVGLLLSVPKLTGEGLSEGIYGTIPDYIHPPAGCRFFPRCPDAMPCCKEKKPNLITVEDGHEVSCFKAGRG